MTVRDVLLQAVHHLRRNDRVRAVTIARAEPHAYQVRLIPDPTVDRGYRVSGRRWIIDKRPGTEYEGWGPWSNFLGFSIDGALADDWTIHTMEES